jgi:hypothetical protein
MIRGWPRLQGWIDADRAGLLVHRRLTVAAQEWLRLGRDEGALFRGARLAEALEWHDQHRDLLSQEEVEFLAASRMAEDTARIARGRRTQVAFVALVAALLIVSVVAALLAIRP